MIRGAVLSDDGRYRYSLERRWEEKGNDCGTIGWVMLNPSTADVMEDDPTIRRCIGFSEAWGYSGMIICNLMAWRSTDPAELPDYDQAMGPLRDHYLVRMGLECDDIVLAWGANRGKRMGWDNVRHTLDLLRSSQSALRTDIMSPWLHCLGCTASGDPKHPLYLAKDTALIPWDRAQSQLHA